MMKYISQFFKSTPILMGLSLIFYSLQTNVSTIFSHHFGVYDLHKLPVMTFYDVYSLLWFLVFPFFTNKFIFKEKPQEMGLALPEKKMLALFLIAFALLLLVPWIIYFAHRPDFSGYSFGSPSILQFTLMTITLYPLYYVGEEFFFRGFLFLGLWKRVGWHSFWITDIVFTLSHIGKPWPEIIMCIPVSVIFNCLTLWTRSIFPAVVVHTVLGIVLSTIVTYKIY